MTSAVDFLANRLADQSRISCTDSTARMRVSFIGRHLLRGQDLQRPVPAFVKVTDLENSRRLANPISRSISVSAQHPAASAPGTLERQLPGTLPPSASPPATVPKHLAASA
jgi:hypothetical protein